MTEITLTARPDKNFSQNTIIKHGRKKYAEIWEREDGTYQVSLNGFAWNKNSLDEAHRLIIDDAEGFLAALGAEARVTIK